MEAIMSLMVGGGPFGPGGGQFSFGPIPDNLWYVEDWPRRMRAVFAGETVLDSRRGKLLHERGAFPAHYYPMADLRADLLVPADEPGRWSVTARGRTAHGAVTARNGVAPLDGYVTIDHGAMDRWFEEDDPVYAHPRDPYHRVDVRASSRHVVVRHNSEMIAESHRPKLLFETGIPVRYYLPIADVRIDLLDKSDTVSQCPYKGDGQHWHLRTGDTRIDDAAWSLPHPLPEGFAAAQHICFYPDKVDIEVDGEPVKA
jgi:uncharacterized protein (DUF427 family)